MVDMSQMPSFYKPEKTMSVIDPARMKIFVQRLQSNRKMVRSLESLTVFALRAPHQREAIADCITKALATWASSHAMLEKLDDNHALGRRQAMLLSVLSSVTFANAYAVSSASAVLPQERIDLINGWFRQLQAAQIAEFTARPRKPQDAWLDVHTNQWMWAGASVSSLATETGDRKAFAWGMSILDTALDEAPADGGLPEELRRGQRGLHYQSFAMTALAVLLANADANGHVLTPDREKALRNLAEFSLNAYLDPRPIEQMTGKPQERKPDMLVWIPAFAEHYRTRDPGFAKRLTDLSMTKGVDEPPSANCCAFPPIR